MPYTVSPLHNLTLPVGSRAAFGAGFVLQAVPDWVKDAEMIKNMSWTDQQWLKQAQFALVAEYDSPAIGSPDPEWTGKEPRSIQKSKADATMLANLAMWLVQPSKVCFTNVFHALCWPIPGQTALLPIVQCGFR